MDLNNNQQTLKPCGTQFYISQDYTKNFKTKINDKNRVEFLKKADLYAMGMMITLLNNQQTPIPFEILFTNSSSLFINKSVLENGINEIKNNSTLKELLKTLLIDTQEDKKTAEEILVQAKAHLMNLMPEELQNEIKKQQEQKLQEEQNITTAIVTTIKKFAAMKQRFFNSAYWGNEKDYKFSIQTGDGKIELQDLKYKDLSKLNDKVSQELTGKNLQNVQVNIEYTGIGTIKKSHRALTQKSKNNKVLPENNIKWYIDQTNKKKMTIEI